MYIGSIFVLALVCIGVYFFFFHKKKNPPPPKFDKSRYRFDPIAAEEKTLGRAVAPFSNSHLPPANLPIHRPIARPRAATSSVPVTTRPLSSVRDEPSRSSDDSGLMTGLAVGLAVASALSSRDSDASPSSSEPSSGSRESFDSGGGSFDGGGASTEW